MANPLRRPVRRPAPKPVATQDPAVRDLQRQVSEQQRQPNPWGQGVELDVTMAGSEQVVEQHRLGRVPVGWIVTDSIYASGVTPPARVTWDETSVSFYSDGPFSGKVWIY